MPEVEHIADRLLGVLGHELRSAAAPLVFMAEGQLIDDARTAMVFTRNVARLLAVIDRVDEVAQLRGSRASNAVAPFDLCALVRSTVDALEPLAHERGIVVVTVGVEALPISSHRESVGRVVRHVLDNAIRHSGCKNVIVLVEFREGFAHVTILDDGTGLGSIDRSTLFDASARRTVTPSSGFGIGLWVAHNTCVQLGGTLELVASANGSCFRITIPIEPPTKVF